MQYCENSGGLQLEHEAWTLRAPLQTLQGDHAVAGGDVGDDGAGGEDGGDVVNYDGGDYCGVVIMTPLLRRFDWGECLHKAGDFPSGRQGDQKGEICDAK